MITTSITANMSNQVIPDFNVGMNRRQLATLLFALQDLDPARVEDRGELEELQEAMKYLHSHREVPIAMQTRARGI